MNLPLYLVAINLLTYALYWQDKRAAINGSWRISEGTLLLSGLAGGTFGAFFAQRQLRHKNRKATFQFKFWALTVIQIGLLVVQPHPLPQIFARFLG